MELNPTISQFYLLLVTGIGIVLFLVLRQVKQLSHAHLSKLTRFQDIVRLLPALEGLMWLIFVLTAIPLVFQDKFFYSIGILMILIVTVGWLSWFFVRDFIAGIMLRSNRSFELEDRLKFKDFEGILKRIGHFSMTLETDEGLSTVVPFSAISGTMFSKIETQRTLKNQTFQIQIHHQTKHKKSIDYIRQLVLIAPWTSIRHQPKVIFLADHQDYSTYEITIFGMEECYLLKVKNYLENHLNS